MNHRLYIFSGTLLLVPLLALGGCQPSPQTSVTETDGGSGGQAPVATNAVSIQNFAFEPRSITVAAGTTVTWTNDDITPHTITAMDGSFDSGTVESGGTFSHTFTAGGTVAYRCDIHPNMTATVVVTP